MYNIFLLIKKIACANLTATFRAKGANEKVAFEKLLQSWTQPKMNPKKVAYAKLMPTFRAKREDV